MTPMNRKLLTACLVVWLAGLLGCAPEVGSDKWCQQLKDKPKGDWSMNEATDFAKHCILK